ncbi:right-handed parallel beta-helix repeat-containing protein [Gayadomonas joobiniege]|uniref:right-handed parallel beta-helix repeat-containing protein n=1 Tax=Gayadomonas joobiniege TaxID=1234606 RepID=UPI00037A08C4|nr:right-handed parallel beta-helix repeat-containing protein [Gayadomonas joobiniege]
MKIFVSLFLMLVFAPLNYAKTFYVSETDQLLQAVKQLNNSGSGGQIYIYPGHYYLSETLTVTTDRVQISQVPELSNPVILDGKLGSIQVNNLILVAADDFKLSGVTLQNAKHHLVQIASELGANRPRFERVTFRDAYQQLLKVSYDTNIPTQYSSGGVVRNCYFYFSKGVAFQSYTGGIDAHAVQNWQIVNNVFKDISSPSESIAEHAIHLWNNTKNNRIQGNVIINSDRGIGLGLGEPDPAKFKFGNHGGLIENNFIFHNNNQAPFADVGIGLESSPETIVKNNWIYLMHDYPNAIEYRFSKSKNITVKNNYINKKIISRNGASAAVSNNKKLDQYDFLSALQAHLTAINMQVNPPSQSLDGF